MKSLIILILAVAGPYFLLAQENILANPNFDKRGANKKLDGWEIVSGSDITEKENNHLVIKPLRFSKEYLTRLCRNIRINPGRYLVSGKIKTANAIVFISIIPFKGNEKFKTKGLWFGREQLVPDKNGVITFSGIYAIPPGLPEWALFYYETYPASDTPVEFYSISMIPQED